MSAATNDYWVPLLSVTRHLRLKRIILGLQWNDFSQTTIERYNIMAENN